MSQTSEAIRMAGMRSLSGQDTSDSSLDEWADPDTDVDDDDSDERETLRVPPPVFTNEDRQERTTVRVPPMPRIRLVPWQILTLGLDDPDFGVELVSEDAPDRSLSHAVVHGAHGSFWPTASAVGGSPVPRFTPPRPAFSREIGAAARGELHADAPVIRFAEMGAAPMFQVATPTRPPPFERPDDTRWWAAISVAVMATAVLLAVAVQHRLGVSPGEAAAAEPAAAMIRGESDPSPASESPPKPGADTVQVVHSTP